MKLVLATKNKNKIIEIRNKFSGMPDLELIPQTDFPNSPDVIEDGSTYEENARKKALLIADFTKLPVMADDSGLEVEALGKRPGVYSARYGDDRFSDTERNLLLLKEMQNIPGDKRNAKFICVIALHLSGNEIHTVRGECDGIISFSLKGKNGFGYDPIFFVPEYRCTMAELSIDVKNRISHRALALDRAREILLNYLKLLHPPLAPPIEGG